jgi:hypothetical protein
MDNTSKNNIVDLMSFYYVGELLSSFSDIGYRMGIQISIIDLYYCNYRQYYITKLCYFYIAYWFVPLFA